MSNTTTKRLGRWFIINLFVAAVMCGLTGRYQDPWLWGFIATLAFDGTTLLDSAKVGILGGSIVWGVVGAMVVRRGTRSA